LNQHQQLWHYHWCLLALKQLDSYNRKIGTDFQISYFFNNSLIQAPVQVYWLVHLHCYQLRLQ
jgi:hypothetical protein